MPTGPKAFLELPVMLGFGLATGPTLKTALCHIRMLMRHRINTAATQVSVDFPLVSSTFCPVGEAQSTSCGACCTVYLDVSHHWIYLWPQGAVPPGFDPLQRDWVYRQVPEAL